MTRVCRIALRLLGLATGVCMTLACGSGPAGPRAPTVRETDTRETSSDAQPTRLQPTQPQETASPVAAFFEEHAGCDEECEEAGGGHYTMLGLRSPRRISSLSIPGGTAELWTVEWTQHIPIDGRREATALVLAMPASGPVQPSPDATDPGSPSDLFPAEVEGRVLILLGQLSLSFMADNVEHDRQLVGPVSAPRIEGGVLRTSFEVFERLSHYLSRPCDLWDERSLELGPQFAYRVEVLCAPSDAEPPPYGHCGRVCLGRDRCEAGTCGGGGILCRTLLTQRRMIDPGGYPACDAFQPRTPTPDELRTEEVQISVRSAEAIRVGTRAPRPLDQLSGVPPFEALCPMLHTYRYCSRREDQERYEQATGVPLPR